MRRRSCRPPHPAVAVAVLWLRSATQHCCCSLDAISSVRWMVSRHRGCNVSRPADSPPTAAGRLRRPAQWPWSACNVRMTAGRQRSKAVFLSVGASRGSRPCGPGVRNLGAALSPSRCRETGAVAPQRRGFPPNSRGRGGINGRRAAAAAAGGGRLPYRRRGGHACRCPLAAVTAAV